MADQALPDIKVVDLSQHVAGPYCTKLMADYGAEVIKIEKPGQGDVTRSLGPFKDDIPGLERSGLFLHLNTNKKSLTLNLKTATGQKILKDLVKEADILVESYPPLVAQRLGVTYEEMEKVNPRLVMSSITNFGQFGLYRDYKATDMLIFAAGGGMHKTGISTREPLKTGNYSILYLAGMGAAVMTMGAFFGARYQGIGQHVDISLMEQAAGTMDRGGPDLVAAAYSGDITMKRVAGGRTSLLPAGAWPCADGYFFSQANPPSWPRFAQLIERPELGTDKEWQDNLFNPEYWAMLDGMVLAWSMEHTKQEILERAQELGLIITVVKTPEDGFHDPHYRGRGFFVESEHPEVGKFDQLGPPFRMMETPWQAGRAPLLGEHNKEILGDRLGYTREDLVRLRERGVI